MIKLIGTVPSPFVRKVRIALIEKNIPYEFIIHNPWDIDTRVIDYNPLGKIPAMITAAGAVLYDSSVLIDYLEMQGTAPTLVPADATQALRIKQLVVLAEGTVEAGILTYLEKRRPADAAQTDWIKHQMGKVQRGLAALADHALHSPELQPGVLNLASIATGCALQWLAFRLPHLTWRNDHPSLQRLSESLSQRASFNQTAPG